MSSMLLDIQSFDKHFGGLHVTKNVSFSLGKGERVALIGPNGAGKTTLVNQISGVLRPDTGKMSFLGEDVTALSQAVRVSKGLVRTFQLTTLAQHLPVQRQIELALFERENLSTHFWQSIDSYPALTQEALSILDSLGLREFSALPTENLAYGEQRLVEIGLALALNPKVLLLDEPMAGVPRGEGTRMLDALNKLSNDLAVLIIEHDMDLVFSFAQRIIVLSEGEVLAVGTPDEIRSNQKVKSVYLGS